MTEATSGLENQGGGAGCSIGGMFGEFMARLRGVQAHQ